MVKVVGAWLALPACVKSVTSFEREVASIWTLLGLQLWWPYLIGLGELPIGLSTKVLKTFEQLSLELNVLSL